MGGPPEASILVTGDKVSCSNAAFANGEMINDLDYDALMRVKDRTPHITPFVMSAPLAVAEHQGASGKELLLAIVLAHEIGARIVSSVRAIRSWQGEEQEGPLAYGYSSAAFGGAIGVCKILGFDSNQIANTMGIACHMIPVPTAAKWRFSSHSPLHKYCVAGWQGMIAVTAATLTQLGYDSDLTCLDGARGFWRMYGTRDACDWRAYSHQLGKEWHISNVEYKRYPCCGMTHAHLTLFSNIIHEHGIKPEEITRVEVKGGARGLNVPLRVNRDIHSYLDTQFSNYYGFAAIAYGIKPLDWQDPRTYRDSRIIRFMDRVTWEIDPALTAYAIVNVYARDTKYTKEGKIKEILTPLSDNALVAKFQEAASKTLHSTSLQAVIQTIMNLEELEDVQILMKQLAT